jgi:hypothetical protein
MKNLKSILLASLLTIGTFASVVFSSCNPDACKDVVCANGGNCNDGSCACAVGYEGSRCETESRTKLYGTFLLSGTDSDGGTYTNLSTTVSASATSPTKFLLNIASAFNLTCTMTSGNSFTIDNITLSGFTYTGSGTYTGTTLTLIMNETDATGTVIYNLAGNKQ